jgi:hypothetical protein
MHVLTLEDRRNGSHAAGRTRQRQADDFARQHGPLIMRLRSRGLSYRMIGEELDAFAVRPRTAKNWTAVSVRNLLERFARLTEVANNGPQ